MGKLRLGYVGCGFMAQAVHIPNIMLLDNCELSALAEVRPKLGAKVQQRWGVPKLYKSHLELAADKNIDAVAVSGQYVSQGEIAIDLLKAGKDVFMEKPMAVTLQQAQRMLEAEKASGRRLMIAYMKRYDAGNVAVKKLLDTFSASGELGKIAYVRNHGFGGDWTGGLDAQIEQTDEAYPPSPKMIPSWCPEKFYNGYIGYLQQYTHNVNLLRWFLGSPASVKSVHLDPVGGVNGVVVLEIGHSLCTIESGWVPFHGWEEHTQVYFEKGWLKTEAPPLLLRNVPATVEVYRADKEEKSQTSIFPAGGRVWAYKEEMRQFVQCVQTGQPFRSPAADAMEDVRLLEDIYRKFVEQQ